MVFKWLCRRVSGTLPRRPKTYSRGNGKRAVELAGVGTTCSRLPGPAHGHVTLCGGLCKVVGVIGWLRSVNRARPGVCNSWVLPHRAGTGCSTPHPHAAHSPPRQQKPHTWKEQRSCIAHVAVALGQIIPRSSRPGFVCRKVCHCQHPNVRSWIDGVRKVFPEARSLHYLLYQLHVVGLFARSPHTTINNTIRQSSTLC